MQGEYGSQLYREHGIDSTNPETLIVVEHGKLYRNSDAIIRIYELIGWPWKAVIALKLIPRSLRDPVYLWIARNRYRIFGERDQCWLPSAEHVDRVI